MTEKRMTDREFFDTLLTIDAVAANPALVDRINHKKALLDKKSTSKKMTDKQVANQGLLAEILAHMKSDPNRLFTITELIKEVPACADLSNQKVSAVIRKGIESGDVEKIVDGRKSCFRFVSK